MKKKRKASVNLRRLDRKSLVGLYRTRGAHARSRGKSRQRKRDIRNAS
jgi:hypothetical protein